MRLTRQYQKPRHGLNQLPSESTSLDRWLVRLSHLSQFGLLLFTVGTIYFTVIPLYQKALLEESIAKKEVELREASALLDVREKLLVSAQETLTRIDTELVKTRQELGRAQLKTYVQERDGNLFAMVFNAGAACTGLLRRSIDLDPDSPTRRKEPFEENFALSPNCIREAFDKSRLRTDLKEQDLQHFSRQIDALAKSIRTQRELALRAANNLPDAARKDPKLLRPPNHFEARMEAILSRVKIIDPLPVEEQRRRTFERAVARTRNAISDEYLGAVRAQIGALRDTSWPIKVEPDAPR